MTKPIIKLPSEFVHVHHWVKGRGYKLIKGEDESIQKMREMGFPEEMITFHPDDSQEIDFETAFDDDFIKDREPKTPCTHEETHSVNGWDRCFDCGVVLDKFGYIKEQFHEHFESLNDDIMLIVKNQFPKHDSEQWRKMSATNYLNAELLKTLSKDQLIDIIIQTEFTVDSFGDEIQQEDK